MLKKWMGNTLYLPLAITMIVFLCLHAPNVEYDIDPSYILFGPARPPLYPLFIWLFQFAKQYQFYFIMWVQAGFVFTALLYARHWLHTRLQLAEFLIFLVNVLVILTISFHFQIWFIQSEGLAFPLFIFSFFLWVDCFQKADIKKIIYLSLITSAIVLTRLQFYYFYLLFAVLCLWYFWQRIPTKKLILITTILGSSVILTTAINHTYHYIKHGAYNGGSYSGLLVLVQALYLANQSSLNSIHDPIEKNYVKDMLAQRDAAHLNQTISSLKPSSLAYLYQGYSRSYLALQDIIDNTLQTSIEKSNKTASIYQANLIATHISKTLIQQEFKLNLIFLFWKFIQCMGGITLFLFYTFLLMALFFHIIKNPTRQFNLSFIFIAVITLITFCNAAIIALCNPDLPVYFCYSQWMLYCLAALLVNQSFTKK